MACHFGVSATSQLFLGEQQPCKKRPGVPARVRARVLWRRAVQRGSERSVRVGEGVCAQPLPHGRLVTGQNGRDMKEEPINSFLPCADNGRAF